MRAPCAECGARLEAKPKGATGFTEEQRQHLVWAVRRDGELSNLGFCPAKRGMDGAVTKAASFFGRASYRGAVTE